MLNKFGVAALTVFLLLAIFSGQIWSFVWMFLIIAFLNSWLKKPRAKLDASQAVSAAYYTPRGGVQEMPQAKRRQKNKAPIPEKLKEKLENRKIPE